MGAAERRKGKVAELEVAALLKAHGFPDELARNLSQAQPGGSVIDLKGTQLVLQVKRRESLALASWLRQTREGADGGIPCVAYRKNRTPWRFLIELTPAQLTALAWQVNWDQLAQAEKLYPYRKEDHEHTPTH